MLRIFVLAFSYLLFLVAQAHAVEVHELDLGACWAKAELTGGKTVWQVASFNDDRNFYYPLTNQLDDATTSELKRIFKQFPSSHFRVDLHCSGAGHGLFISFYDAKTPVCVWAKRSAETNFEFIVEQVVPNPLATPDQPCMGISPGSLLVLLKDKNSARTVETYLRGRYSRYLNSIRTHDSIGMLSISLKPMYHFNEKLIREIWQKDRVLKHWVKSVEYDPLMIIVGSYLKLRTDAYPGF